MQFKSQSKISFMCPSQGEFKNDQAEEVKYDSTKVHIQTDLSGDVQGFGKPYIEYKWGSSDNYHEFVRKYGELGEFLAEITWENIATAKSSKLTVIDVKPVQTQVPAKA